MLTEGWQRPPCCWATPPSSLLGRQGKKYSSSLNSDPRRRRGVYALRAKMSNGSTGRETDEEYQQFNSMLGEAPNANSQIADAESAKSAAYADFADMLGLEGNDTEQVDTKNSVAKLSPKKVEIDPADYSLFDAMLERTGGRGTKPVKGGKRYTTYVSNDKKRVSKQDVLQKAAESETWDFVDVPEENTTSTPPKHILTDEEKAQAYAVMMEEFGPGVHEAVETWSPYEEVDELEPEVNQLLEPPERPGVPRPPDSTVEYDRTTSEAAAAHKDAIDEADSLTLEPKPSRPSHDDRPSLDETTAHAVEEDMEAAVLSTSSPTPLPHALKDQSQLDEEQVAPTRDGAKHEVKLELVPPPVRSPEEDEIANDQAAVAKPRLPEPVISTQGDSSEENSTVRLLKLNNRPDPVAASTTGSQLQLDANASRSPARTRFSRNQRFKDDEPVIILKNPKLVYNVNE